MVLIINSCELNDSNNSLVQLYVNNFESINKNEFGVYLVIPSNSCVYCIKEINDLLKSDELEKNIIVISDIKKLKTKRDLIIDEKQGRITQYNPFVNSPYVFCLNSSGVIDVVEVTNRNVNKLQLIIDELYDKNK